jgi:ATP-dependent Clp protease protease subunit
VQRILVGANSWQGKRAARVHLLFQSPGGLVGDGVFLYNYFRAVPFDLYLYNVGQVSSIGTIAFLGGHRRIASAHASFMIHRSTFIPNMSTAARLQAIGRGLTVDDQRTEAILREHISLEPQQWDELHHHDLILSAPEALKCGLVHEISEVVVPRGSIVISLQSAFQP